MIVKLTRAARIPHEAGEIVKVSPDFANILFSQGAAVNVTDGEKNKPTGDTPATKTKTTKKKE